MADRTVRVTLTAEVNRYIAGMQAARASTADFGRSAAMTARTHSGNWQTMTRASAVGTGILAIGLGAAIKSNMEFETSMSAVSAAADANGQQLNLLREVALQAGKDTKFSATEAAQGEEELAKAGLKVADIAGGALTGALNLAAAGNISVASAAEIAATTLSQFSLEGSQASHVADLLSAAANNAQGGVADMGEALKFIGPVASQMGVSLEQTVGTIALLASKGILGSMAGESLRGMILSLTSPSQIAAKTMNDLGISVYDATGQFIGFEGVAGQLHDRMKGLTAAERDEAFGRMFGNAQVTTARILYAGGADAVKMWTERVDDSGNAADTAGEKTNNLSGDLEKLRGSISTALIEGGETGTAPLRDLSQAAQGVVDSFSAVPKPVQQAAIWVTAAGVAALGATTAFGFLWPKVLASRAALASIGPAGTKAAAGLTAATRAAGAFGLAAVGVGAVTLGANWLTDQFKDAPPTINETTKALRTLADQGVATDAMLRQVGDSAFLADDSFWGKAQQGIAKYVSAIGPSTGVLGLFTSDLADAKEANDRLDESLAGMVSSGHAGTAAEAVAALGLSAAEAKEQFPGYADALTGAGNAAQGAAGSTDKVGGSAKAAGAAFAGAKMSIDEYKTALDGLNNANIAATSSEIARITANEALGASFKKNGATLNLNTAAGKENVTAILGAADAASKHAQSVADQTGSIDKANAAFAADVGALRAVLQATNLTDAQVEALIATYARVPQLKQTKVSAPGAKPAADEVQTLNSRIAALKAKQVAIRQSGAEHAALKISLLQREIDGLRSRTITIATNRVDTIIETRRLSRAGGGKVHGPGTRTSDSVPLWASRDEWVIQASSAAKYGDAFMSAINAGSFAGGGRVAMAGSPVRASVASGSTYVSIAHLSLPNVQNVQQLVQELRAFAGRNGGRIGIGDIV